MVKNENKKTTTTAPAAVAATATMKEIKTNVSSIASGISKLIMLS